jgi:hypothetical protein
MKSIIQTILHTEPRSLRLPIGPSPWGFVNRSVKVQGNSYRFKETVSNDRELSGLISLQNPNGLTLLVLDFYCYARLLDDGTALLWRETENKIAFDRFHLSSLQPVEDLLVTAKTVREKKLGYSPLSISQHWEISPHLSAGKPHPFDIPFDWSPFEETLVLTDHSDSDGFDKMARAILAFDWSKRQVEVFPQDWFNQGDYDFGYQWITRVARRTDGAIVGDGIRLNSFELDETNRQIKKWLTQNPFNMIK